jgi:hypothetical protein
MPKRKRKIGSIKNELISKSKEAILSAIEIFNNPNIQFKSESFIVLAIIAWTYLLHAYYRNKKIEYRYFDQRAIKKVFHKTKHGADKYWELERCLDDDKCPIDNVTKINLKFLIGLRHEIEHQMTTKIDNLLSARFQACCLNYNDYLKKLFPKQSSIEDYLSFSLQFSSMGEEQIDQISKYENLPQNILTYIQDFDQTLSEEEYNDSKFSYRVLFIPKIVNRKGQADRVIEFVSPDSEAAKGINKEYFLIKEKEKNKYSATEIIKKMQAKGYINFRMHQHTKLWQREDGKNPAKGFGVMIVKTWYWYDSWLSFVEKNCKENRESYT